VAEHVGRSALQSLDDPGHIGREMVQADPVQRSLTVPYAAHVDGDDPEPCRNKTPREFVKIAGAAARIREQDERVSRSIFAPAFGAARRTSSDFASSEWNPAAEDRISVPGCLAGFGLHRPGRPSCAFRYWLAPQHPKLATHFKSQAPIQFRCRILGANVQEMNLAPIRRGEHQ